jgi:CBS domain-containing protein
LLLLLVPFSTQDISGVPVVDARTGKIKGNISARDARLIVSSNKIYKLLNLPISTYLDVVTGDHQENAAITCSPKETLAAVIKRMVSSRIHRIFVVDEDEYIIRVVSLRNILRKFVREPEGE